MLIKNKILFAALLVFITTVGLMATDIYTPSLPIVGATFHASLREVQFTITIFLIAAGFSQLIYGPLSDYFGRRPILLIGFLFYIAGSCVCAVSTNILMLWVGRLLQGFGTGAIMSLNRVIIRDAFAGPQLSKVLSYIGTFIALAPAVAPAVGGLIQNHWGWHWVFGVLIVLGIVGLVWAYSQLPETNSYKKQSMLSFAQVFNNYKNVINNKIFWGHALCSGFALSAMITYSTLNPYLFEIDLKQTPGEYGFWAMIGAIGFIFGMISNSKLVYRLGTERVLHLGNYIMFAMGLILIILGLAKVMNVAAIILPTIGIAYGVALVFPNAFVGAIAPFSKIAGAAGALYGSLQIIITFLTSIIVSDLNQNSQLPMGCIILSISVLAVLGYKLLVGKYKPDVEPGVIAE